MRHIDPTASEYITSGYLARSRPGGVMYDPGSILGAGASVVGGLIGADASEDAADAQAQAAANANALQEKMFNKQVELQEPWRQAGMGGLNRLSYLLGLSPTGYGGQGSMSSGQLETADQIRARLTGAYTRPGTGGATPPPGSTMPNNQWSGGQYGQPGAEYGTGGGGQYVAPGTGPTVDSAALDRAVRAEMAKQQAELKKFQAAGANASKNDPLYGSLLDKFSMDDFEQDPGYQFRMDEGMKALERSAAARGGLFSGRAMKDTLRFGQGLGSQEYGAAFDRFNVQNTNTFNRLASIAGVGQTAANQTGAAAANYGNAAAGNIIGAGNAAAAGRVGGANAISGGIGQGISAYQNNQMMNKLFPSAGGGGGGWQPYGGPSAAGGWSQPDDYGQYL
jgi:hypothetical protein